MNNRLKKEILVSGLLIACVCMLVYYALEPIGEMKRELGAEFPEAGELFTVDSSLVPFSDGPARIYPQKVSAISFDGELDFAGEAVPFGDFDVKERLERELLINMYWHSSTIYNFKLSGRYFPEIERILKEEGVPEDFKYLAMAESGLKNVVSPAKAVGIWQIVEGTAKEHGLEVNSEVDERYNLARSTRAACGFLKEAYERFGSWTLAAASYNMGKAGLSKVIERQKADKNYYDLYLNSETARYVFRILALKEIYTKPEAYGFYFSDADLYDPLSYRTITIDSSIGDLAEFANSQQTTYKMVKLYNPWLRARKLSNTSGKSYEVRLPPEENN